MQTKTKRICTLLCTVCALLLMCGCIEQRADIVINSDGSGTVSYAFQINRSVVDRYFSELPAQLQNAYVRQIGGEDYYCGEVKPDAETLDQQIKSLCLFGSSKFSIFSSASADAERLVLITNPIILSASLAAVLESEQLDIYELIKLKLTITMPYEIKEYNAGELSYDKRTVNITLGDLGHENRIEIYSPKPFDPTVLIHAAITAASVAAIGCASFGIIKFVQHRKRKLAEAMPDIPVDKKTS